MPKRTLLIAALATALVTGLLGPSTGAGAAPADAGPRDGALSRIAIVAFTYLPDPLVVKGGTRVAAINLDDAIVQLIPGHSITADNGSFNTGVFFGVDSFKAPSARGVYRYHCLVHGFMHGVLIVR
jgi:plastocyanin